jgi:hypothetical protein
MPDFKSPSIIAGFLILSGQLVNGLLDCSEWTGLAVPLADAALPFLLGHGKAIDSRPWEE